MKRKDWCGLPFIALACLLFAGIAGCGGRTTVILLPDQDGNVGSVSVTSKSGTVNITRAGESVVVRGGERVSVESEILSEQEVRKEYARVLDSLPGKPLHFRLYFKSESTTLTGASRELVPEILSAIEERQSISISVVGHTDTAGDEEYNEVLSLKRAESVKRLLADAGVDTEIIETDSHGEHNLLVKTGDGVHEPKNRRVEVVVR